MTAFEQAWAIVKGEMFSPHIPRKIDAEAIIEAKENPDLIQHISNMPKPLRLVEEDFDDSGYGYDEEARWRRNVAMRDWVARQETPIYEPHIPPVNSLWWNDMDELMRYENIPVNSPDTEWSEGITEETSGAWDWLPKLEQSKRYADFYRRGHTPPPIRSVINVRGDNEWRHSISDGHHRGVMANILNIPNLLGGVSLTGKTGKGYARGIAPKDLDEFYDLARDAL